MLKKIALFFLIFIPSAFAKQIMSYQEAVDALNEGRQLRYVIDWDLCEINIPGKPNFSSSYSPENVNITKSGIIQSRGLIFSHTISAFPNLRNVKQAYEYNFTKDNELIAVDYFLDAVTYEEKMYALKATCQLGTGFKVFA